MRGINRIVIGLLMSLPVVGQETSAAQSDIPVPALQQTQTDTCKALVQRAREVERLLRMVGDRESADATAAQISLHLEEMKKGFAHLEKQPPVNVEETREVAMEMRALAHVMQGIMPVLQKLREVNAYGSESLINVFYMYKLLPSTNTPEQMPASDVWFRA